MEKIKRKNRKGYGFCSSFLMVQPAVEVQPAVAGWGFPILWYICLSEVHLSSVGSQVHLPRQGSPAFPRFHLGLFKV
jgi:hypothetical protein